MYVAPGALSARFVLSPRVIGDGYLVVAEPVVSGRNSVVGYIETQVKRAGEQHTREGAAQEVGHWRTTMLLGLSVLRERVTARDSREPSREILGVSLPVLSQEPFWSCREPFGSPLLRRELKGKESKRIWPYSSAIQSETVEHLSCCSRSRASSLEARL